MEHDAIVVGQQRSKEDQNDSHGLFTCVKKVLDVKKRKEIATHHLNKAGNNEEVSYTRDLKVRTLTTYRST